MGSPAQPNPAQPMPGHTRPCHVSGCDGNHDQYMHPAHNCRPPRSALVGSTWQCDCGKKWVRSRYRTGWALEP